MLKYQDMWKYFFYILTFLFLTEIVLKPPQDIFEAFSTFLVALSLLALYGFSHQKGLGKQVYWKVNFAVQTFFFLLALYQSIPILLYRNINLYDFLIFTAFALLAGLITIYWFYGQYAYAFKASKIWDNARKAHK